MYEYREAQLIWRMELFTRVSGLTDSVMAKENSPGKTAHNMKALGSKEEHAARANCITQMATCMMEIGKTTRLMVTEHTGMQMARNTSENGLMTSSTGEALKLGPMEQSTTACTKWERRMDSENSRSLTGLSMRGNFK